MHTLGLDWLWKTEKTITLKRDHDSKSRGRKNAQKKRKIDNQTTHSKKKLIFEIPNKERFCRVFLI